jgi:hypothetical protein
MVMMPIGSKIRRARVAKLLAVFRRLFWSLPLPFGYSLISKLGEGGGSRTHSVLSHFACEICLMGAAAPDSRLELDACEQDLMPPLGSEVACWFSSA